MSKPILVLDVAFVNLGYAVVLDGQPIDTGCHTQPKNIRKTAVRKGDADLEWCMTLARKLNHTIKTEGVAGVVAEVPGAGARSQRAAATMSMARGVVAAVVETHGLPVEWTTPQEGKMAACGSEQASKGDVVRAIGLRWPQLDEPGEHVCDALAAYLAAENGSLVRLLNPRVEVTVEAKA